MRSLISVAFGVLSAPALAAPCTVDTSGAGSHSSLTAAINNVMCTDITIVDAYLNERVEISRDMTINGAPTVLDGAGIAGGRVVDISAGTVTLNDLVVVGGDSGGIRVEATANLTMSGGGVENNVAVNGGGIYVEGELTLDGARILDNEATDFGGGIFVAVDGTVVLQNDSRARRNLAGIDGGGVRASGDVALDNSDVINNDAGQDGGGIALVDGAALNVNASRINNNIAARDGGGIHGVLAGPITLDVSAMRRNSATAGDGGAIYADGADTRLTGSLIRNNIALAGSGGGILAQDAMGVMLSLDGSTVSENVADLAGGVLAINLDSASAIVKDSTIELNVAKSIGGFGGSAAPIDILDSIIRDNEATAGDAGGIAMLNDSTLVMTDSVVSGNTAFQNGGGLLAADSEITVQRSAIGVNAATQDGGGLYADRGKLEVINSTVGRNTAGGVGGGVSIDAAGTVQLRFSTIIDNDAVLDGNQLRASNCNVNLNAVAIGAENIVATGPNDCSVSSLFSEDTHDLDGTCTDVPVDGDQPGPSVGGAPLGLPSFAGGGFTPALGSRLIGAVTATLCPAVDQLGAARPATGCTVGAVE